MKYINSRWFSLIEILVGILIISMVMLAWFQSLSAVGIWKIKIIEKTKIEKEAYFAWEKFFEMIKKWGTIDYEEYWNRYSYSTWYTDGHFTDPSGFGNFGDNRPNVWNTSYGRKPYHCLSWLGDNMWTDGCIWPKYNIRFWLWGPDEDKSWPQRYTQYSRQFIDRNSDGDNDGWDEDGDGSIINDADDLHIGIGPKAFIGGNLEAGELYLINAAGNERTLFRWNVITDPDKPPSATCTPLIPWEKSMTWSGCLGTVEFLKLRGEDYGYDHDVASFDGDWSQWDGIIDTWMIHQDFLPNTTPVVAGSNNINYWQSIFPNSIHVSDLRFYLYPNKDSRYSWRDNSLSLQVAPYLQLKMTVQPSWKQKRKIKWPIPSVDITTTIQLSDLNFR